MDENSRISALIDGELVRHESTGALGTLQQEGEAREAWRSYHLIGDAMRGDPMLSAGFAQRVAEKLSQEPTVLAPRTRRVLEQRRWQVLSAAASVAAVGFVTLTFFSQDPAAPQLAQTPAPAHTETAQVAPPETADDYLLAHQGYSPRNSLQGMAPYVRTVSSQARGGR